MMAMTMTMTTDDKDDDAKYTTSMERSHELMNRLEPDIVDCTRLMEDDPTGLKLAFAEQSNYGVNVDAGDALLADWGGINRYGMNSRGARGPRNGSPR
jgi:hypothetical protein